MKALKNLQFSSVLVCPNLDDASKTARPCGLLFPPWPANYAFPRVEFLCGNHADSLGSDTIRSAEPDPCARIRAQAADSDHGEFYPGPSDFSLPNDPPSEKATLCRSTEHV